MNLLQQFPDTTSKSKRTFNNRRREKARAERGYDSKRLELFYDNEFRKWHYKLVLIILFILICLFVVVYTISGLVS
jgi:hypothetical protein